MRRTCTAHPHTARVDALPGEALDTHTHSTRETRERTAVEGRPVACSAKTRAAHSHTA